MIFKGLTQRQKTSNSQLNRDTRLRTRPIFKSANFYHSQLSHEQLSLSTTCIVLAEIRSHVIDF